MGMFLNSRICFEDYRETASDTYFVDKSALIRELIPALGKKNRFFLYYKTAPFREKCNGEYGWGILRDSVRQQQPV